MMEKNILFIDDGDITEQVDKLKRVLAREGIILKEEILNLSEEKFRTVNPEDSASTLLDFGVIKKVLTDEYMPKKFDYVLCDFNLGDKKVNGFLLIKWLKNIARERKERIRNAKYSLYSSEDEKAIKEIFDQEEIGQLIKLKLEDFYKRNRISNDFADSIVHNTHEIDLKLQIIGELEKFQEMKFQSIYTKFKNYSFRDIAKEIEEDSHHGILFQRFMIELTIAHMVELNES